MNNNVNKPWQNKMIKLEDYLSDGIHQPSKRRLLKLSGSVFMIGAMWPFSRANASLTVTKENRFNYCTQCHVMFLREGNGLGRCMATGKGHVPQGYNFRLVYDGKETPNAQTNWRSCNSCEGLFFDGYKTKGHCPASSSGHRVNRDYVYVLPHNVSETKNTQKNWRFCNKCYMMFFNGYADKGKCPAGEGHVAQGYNFVLPYRG